MAPRQRTRRDKMLILGALGFGYLFAVFLSAHLFWIKHRVDSGLMVLETGSLFQAAQQHMLLHPFELFPFPAKEIWAVTLLLFMVGFAVYINEQKKKRMMPGKEEGSAKWNENLSAYNRVYTEPKGRPSATISNAKNKLVSGNMILTNDVSLSMNGKDTRRNNNILVIGGSGAGKSRFFVKPNLLQQNCSFICTDPSGELLESCGGFLEKQGYKVRIFNLVEMQYSDHYNPFAYIRNDEGVLMMIHCLIENTTPKGASKGDPFWEKSETALLLAICFYLHYEIRPQDRNFANVMKLLLKAQVKEDQEDFQSTLDIMFEELEKSNPQHIAVRYYKIFKMGAGKTLKSILISCTVRLGTFNLKAIQNLTCTDTMDLIHVGDEPVALFVVIPSADTTFNYLVSMMYSQLFESLYFHAENECRGKQLPHQVRFMLDEFANIGTIPDFEKKLATMRKYGISCSIVLQNLAQLKTMYKDAWESITGNCDTFLFLGGQEQSTLEYVSKKLGKITILANGYSRSKGGQGSRSESENIKGRDLLTPDEISRMDNEYCILMIRGLFPFYGKKYSYTKHPNYPMTGDADESLLYEYRDPERFKIAESPKHNTKTPAFPRTSSYIRKNATDCGCKQKQESLSRKQRIVQEAKGGRELTVPNLAQGAGLPKSTPLNEVAANLEPIDGFIADYEFRDSEAYHTDFLEKASGTGQTPPPELKPEDISPPDTVTICDEFELPSEEADSPGILFDDDEDDD